jgi:hypothetical protein
LASPVPGYYSYGPYWRIPPELLPVQCPRDAGPREAAYALRSLAALLRRYASMAVGFAAFSLVVVLGALAMVPRGPAAPGFFAAAVLAVVVAAVGFAAYGVHLYRRYSRLASLLERAVGMVEAGLLPPERVCGAAAGAVASMAASMGGPVG